jgi:RNA polymerase sigma-70 factor (ECF subfamily)
MIRSMDRSPPRPQAPADALGAQVPAARRPRTFPAITAKPRISGSPRQPGTDSQGWAEPACLDLALQRARAGDEMAFRALYRDVHPRVLRYLQAVVGADAEDVASETWFQVARDLPGFQGDGDGFRGWAATVARNRATDHLRRARRRPRPAATVTVADLETWAAADDTAGQALELMATDAALALISQLPGDQAEAVLLRVVMGLDAVTAGRVLGKRPGAVRMASYRGLRRLSGWLEQAAANDTGKAE